MRGKKSVLLDLKSDVGVEALLKLAESADVLIEPFRPGVCERLGVGPDVCMGLNPALVYGRMTGWGQDGPLAGAAGHDINYISLTGALYATGRAGEKPVPPLNLVGDMGGGCRADMGGAVGARGRHRDVGGGQQLSVWVGSWNMGAAPPQYDQLHTWIEGAKGAARARHDLYVVATQDSTR